MAKATCAYDGCVNAAYSRGWCSSHYNRWYRTGSPDGYGLTDEQRFWATVNRAGPVPEYAPHLGPCSLWLGTPNRFGYGRFTADGKRWRAHRYAWAVIAGRPLTPGLVLDHLCRVTLCVEVEHLEETTIADNMARSPLAPGARTHCPHGHAYEDGNLYLTAKGHRHCRTCTLSKQRENYRLKRERETP